VDLDAFLDAAVELLAVPSTVDRPDELWRALELALAFVGPGFTVERFESGGVPSALLYAGDGRPDFRLILNAHLDVVPGDPDQFRPTFTDGRLHARGAQDMKVAALVQAQVFRELAGVLPYPLALQLVTDEEVGGRDGTLHQLRHGVTGAFVVIGEQSGLDVVTDAKGLLHVKLLATGVAPLLDALNRLLTRYPDPTGEVWRTTVNVARIATHDDGRAEAWLDIRYPADDPDPIAFFDGVPDVTLILDEHDPPHHTDHGRAEIAALRRAVRDQGHRGDIVRRHGGSDAGFFSARGIPAVEFGVGGAGQHGPHEHVEVATIEPYYRALRLFLERLGQDGAG
jgi:succinyl-diaminopimelate desuccinylase